MSVVQIASGARRAPGIPSGKVVRSRLVMESPGTPSDVADRLRRDSPEPTDSPERNP
jgi:hypothetical protein